LVLLAFLWHVPSEAVLWRWKDPCVVIPGLAARVCWECRIVPWVDHDTHPQGGAPPPMIRVAGGTMVLLLRAETTGQPQSQTWGEVTRQLREWTMWDGQMGAETFHDDPLEICFGKMGSLSCAKVLPQGTVHTKGRSYRSSPAMVFAAALKALGVHSNPLARPEATAVSTEGLKTVMMGLIVGRWLGGETSDALFVIRLAHHANDTVWRVKPIVGMEGMPEMDQAVSVPLGCSSQEAAVVMLAPIPDIGGLTNNRGVQATLAVVARAMRAFAERISGSSGLRVLPRGVAMCRLSAEDLLGGFPSVLPCSKLWELQTRPAGCDGVYLVDSALNDEFGVQSARKRFDAVMKLLFHGHDIKQLGAAVCVARRDGQWRCHHHEWDLHRPQWCSSDLRLFVLLENHPGTLPDWESLTGWISHDLCLESLPGQVVFVTVTEAWPMLYDPGTHRGSLAPLEFIGSLPLPEWVRRATHSMFQRHCAPHEAWVSLHLRWELDWVHHAQSSPDSAFMASSVQAVLAALDRVQAMVQPRAACVVVIGDRSSMGQGMLEQLHADANARLVFPATPVLPRLLWGDSEAFERLTSVQDVEMDALPYNLAALLQSSFALESQIHIGERYSSFDGLLAIQRHARGAPTLAITRPLPERCASESLVACRKAEEFEHVYAAPGAIYMTV
jgi:hypothetical protein